MPRGVSKHMKRIKQRVAAKDANKSNNREAVETDVAPYKCKHCHKPYKSQHHWKTHQSDPTKCPKHPSKSPKRKKRKKVAVPNIVTDNWDIKIYDIDHKKIEKGDSHFVFEYANGDHAATVTKVTYHGRRVIETVKDCIGRIEWEFDDKYHFGTRKNPLGTKTCKMLIDKNNVIFSPFYFNYEHAAQQSKDNNMANSVNNSNTIDLSITDSDINIHPKDGKHDQLLNNMVQEIVRCQDAPSVIGDAEKTKKLSLYLVDVYKMRFENAFFNKDKIQEIHTYILEVKKEPKKQRENNEMTIKKDVNEPNIFGKKKCTLSTEPSGNKIPCRYCFKLLSRQGLKAHIANQHSDELKFECEDPLCTAKVKAFSSECDLQNHTKYFHGSRQNLEQSCPDCDTFRSQNHKLQKRLINRDITNPDGSTRINTSWKNWKIPESYKTFYDVVCSNKLCSFKRKYISDTHFYV